MAKGYSKIQAAAIAGNAQHESANFTAHEEPCLTHMEQGAGFFNGLNQYLEDLSLKARKVLIQLHMKQALAIWPTKWTSQGKVVTGQDQVEMGLWILAI